MLNNFNYYVNQFVAKWIMFPQTFESKVVGLENIPKEGALMLIGNHFNQHIDSLANI